VLHLTAAGNKKFRLCQTKSSVSDPPGTAGKIDVKVTADEKGEKLSVEKLPRGTSGVGLRGAMPSRPVLGRCCCGVAFCDCPNADQAEYRFLKRYDLVDIKV
jgi:hypothetical protein